MIVHLTASRFFGGPERQMLELGQSLRPNHESTFLSFLEQGLCFQFLNEVRQYSFQALALAHDTPQLFSALCELVRLLRKIKASVLCCHCSKPNLLGLLAGRRIGIPVVAVSRGWTGETFRVRVYDKLDRLVLRWMDRVVCVSAAQAEKVRRAGVPRHKVTVIANAIRPERFAEPQPEHQERLRSLFRKAPRLIVGAAGRLSPEKGFDVLVDAATQVVGRDRSVGFVLFGEGPMRNSLTSQIRSRGLDQGFVLAGFRDDLDCYLPYLDLVVLPSFTEGLPNVALEAFAAGVPVVATAVGGTPEVVKHGVNGYLVPPGDPDALAHRIVEVLADKVTRSVFGSRGRAWVSERFSFASQALSYQRLFESITSASTELAHSAGAK